jgi:hypothetical protein
MAQDGSPGDRRKYTVDLGSSDTISVASGDQGDTVNASGDTIFPQSNADITIVGGGNTITVDDDIRLG